MEIRSQEYHPGLRPEDTLPTVNPRGGRRPVRAIGQAHGITHAGRVRPSNEDHYLIADLERTVRLRQTSLPTPSEGAEVTDAEGTVLMVADGMGGHGSGELASSVTLDTVLEYVTYAMPWVKVQANGDERALLTGFGEAVVQCQERLLQVAARKGASQRLGTTLTVAYVSWPDVYVAHVGDSRCYVWREGQLQQVTNDHTLAEQLRRRVGSGEDLAHFDHVLVNAVGGDGQRPEVESHRLRLAPGDRLLLCSDGLYGELDAQAMSGYVGAARSAGEACHSLVSAALAAGGRDNVTAVVAFF